MMKQQTTILFGVLLLLQTACLAPVGTTFDSAEMLEKKEVQIMGAASYYSVSDTLWIEQRNQFNFGAQVAYGVSSNFNLKLRYELLNSDQEFDFFERQITANKPHHYLELNSKVYLGEGQSNFFSSATNSYAFAFPLSLYIIEGKTIGSFASVFLATSNVNDVFDVTFGPQAGVLFNRGHYAYMLGTKIGFGFSKDLRKWAIRPEIGVQSLLGPESTSINWVGGIGVLFTFGEEKDVIIKHSF